MALAYSVTLLADHKGIAVPKVHGDEYYVDAIIDVTSFALMFTTVSTGTTISNDANGGSTRVRVYGLL